MVGKTYGSAEDAEAAYVNYVRSGGVDQFDDWMSNSGRSYPGYVALGPKVSPPPPSGRSRIVRHTDYCCRRIPVGGFSAPYVGFIKDSLAESLIRYLDGIDAQWTDKLESWECQTLDAWDPFYIGYCNERDLHLTGAGGVGQYLVTSSAGVFRVAESFAPPGHVLSQFCGAPGYWFEGPAARTVVAAVAPHVRRHKVWYALLTRHGYPHYVAPVRLAVLSSRTTAWKLKRNSSGRVLTDECLLLTPAAG